MVNEEALDLAEGAMDQVTKIVKLVRNVKMLCRIREERLELRMALLMLRLQKLERRFTQPERGRGRLNHRYHLRPRAG